MRKGFVTIFIIIAIIIVAVILIFVNAGDSSMTSTSNDNNGRSNSGSQTKIVTITDSGYSPQSLTISSGDTVVWKNDGSQENWPASAMHPTHTVYPGSGIEKCGTSEQSGIFDACKGLENGESWSFTFNDAGKWNYHDHLNVRMFGSVSVE